MTMLPSLLRAHLTLVLSAAALLAMPRSSLGQDQLPADVLKKVKRSTVYLSVTLPDGRVLEGSGFLAGGPGVVITNAHVMGMLSMEGRPPHQIDVIVDRGEPSEKKFKGQFAQIDS